MPKEFQVPDTHKADKETEAPAESKSPVSIKNSEILYAPSKTLGHSA